MKNVRILVVDDHEPWRRLVASMVSAHPDFEVVAEAVNGLDAVEKARELQPDIVLLDIGMPVLNGIEATLHIREVSPASKVLLVSEMRIAEVAEEAFTRGVAGYVVKSAAVNELLTAVKAILRGKTFVSALLREGTIAANQVGEAGPGSLPASGTCNSEPTLHRHEVEFYPSDAALAIEFGRRAANSLRKGHAALIMVTESHLHPISEVLWAEGIDVERRVESGDLYFLDVAAALRMVMGDALPDEHRVTQLSKEFLTQAAVGQDRARRDVLICGECAPTLLAEGHWEAAIRLEHLWDEVTKHYAVDSLCGYMLNALPDQDLASVMTRICAEHSVVRGRELVH